MKGQKPEKRAKLRIAVEFLAAHGEIVVVHVTKYGI